MGPYHNVDYAVIVEVAGGHVRTGQVTRVYPNDGDVPLGVDLQDRPLACRNQGNGENEADGYDPGDHQAAGRQSMSQQHNATSLVTARYVNQFCR